jgi:hypothetical protein
MFKIKNIRLARHCLIYLRADKAAGRAGVKRQQGKPTKREEIK